jgi:riboflavin kinase/FMN adenylyltransferase
VFDGLHPGHQAVLQAAREAAATSGGTPVVLTFDPHPSKILRPDQPSRLLTSTAHKLRLIEGFGIPSVLMIHFDGAFAAVTAEAFLRQLAAPANEVRRICIGAGWKFGHARQGDPDLLRRLGPELGFETTEVEPVRIDGVMVSSTLIRQFVEAGDLSSVRRFLGRNYSILGTVLHGDGLGRQLGFPTANLAAHNEQFPPDGVYAVDVRLESQTIRGVANIGSRPTVKSAGERLLEVHLLDYSDNLYGRNIEAEFLRFLRPEKKFPSREALREQIARDAGRARTLQE